MVRSWLLRCLSVAACWLQSDVALNVFTRNVLVVPSGSKIEMLREITSVSSFVGENQWNLKNMFGTWYFKSVHKSENPSTRLSRFRACVRDDTSGLMHFFSLRVKFCITSLRLWLYHINLFSDIWLSCRGGLLASPSTPCPSSSPMYRNMEGWDPAISILSAEIWSISPCLSCQLPY